MSALKFGPFGYGRLLIFVAGCGGLLYGIDVGIIAAALLYLSKTISLTVAQTSAIVAGVLGGGMFSSLCAGVLSDWFGRRKMLIASALIFLLSISLIVMSRGFAMLFVSRLLQGISGGLIAVVVPLYLAECLAADKRGRGTAVFQLMLSFGIVAASVAGFLYTRSAEAAISAAAGDVALVRAAADHAWRGMFLVTLYPGTVFLIGTFFLVETPRWLFRQGRSAEALAALHRLLPRTEAELQMREMQALSLESGKKAAPGQGDSLLRRKYVVPFLLACIVLMCNQTTGISSAQAFLVVILKQAGMTASHATQGDLIVKLIHCIATVIAVALVDRKGRTFLLKIGTAGIVLSLAAAGLLFHTFEVQRVDVTERLQLMVQGDTLTIPSVPTASDAATYGRALSLTVVYSYGHGSKLAAGLDSHRGPILSIVPQREEAGIPLKIERAFRGPVPTERTGWLIAACLALYVSFFSIGPGVVVWLALSELMPTRIRSTGMGIALLLNQGVSTLLAAVFLPVVGTYGYSAMFFFWAGFTTLYFVVAAFLLPETKGRTLEEIEAYFRGSTAPVAS